MWSNPQVIKYWEDQQPKSSLEYVRGRLKRYEDRQIGVFLSWRSLWTRPNQDDSEFVGIFAAHCYANLSVEIAYCLNEKFWGDGLASEAFKGYLLADLGRLPKFTRIFADIHPENAKSVSYLERFSMTKNMDNGETHHYSYKSDAHLDGLPRLQYEIPYDKVQNLITTWNGENFGWNWG